MRTHHWLTAFLSGMMLLAHGWKASAQFPPTQATGQAAYSPVLYDAPAQAGYLPDPAISPFDHVFDETYEENGIWMRDFHNNTQNKYSFTAEAVFGLVMRPSGAKTGHPKGGAATFFFDGDNAISNDDDGPQALNPAWYPTENGRDVFMSRSTALIRHLDGTGIQLKAKMETPDGQFFELSGLGIFDAESHHSYGHPVVRVGERGVDALARERILGTARFWDTFFGPPGGPNRVPTDLIDLNVVTAFMPGVAVNDGTFRGTVIRADHYYLQFMTSDVFGAGFTWGQAARHKFGPFSVQPTFGARYLRVNEHYGLVIHDSATDYAFVDDVDDPLYGTIDSFNVVSGYQVKRMYVDSYTTTNMGGPELGISYDTGSDGFSFLGETKIGVLGAREQSTVTAKGFGQPWLINAIAPPAFLENPAYDPDKFTSRTIEHSFVTPSFLQSISAKSNLLGYVPLVRNIRAFREAEFTAGYSILMLFQLSRPNETIIWNANTGVDPNDPSLVISAKEARRLAPEPKVSRSLWFVQSFNLGVNWEF